MNGSILGMKRREIDAQYDDIVEFSGVERFIDTPVKRYSSGMYVRLAFSVAAHLDRRSFSWTRCSRLVTPSSAPLYRPDGGARKRRQDRRLRLAHAVDRHPAMRSRDSDRQRQRRHRRSGRRGGSRVPSPDTGVGTERTWRGQRRRERPRKDSRGSRRSRTTGCRRNHGRAPTDRDRDRVPCSPDGSAGLPQDQAPRPRGHHRLQRHGHRRSLVTTPSGRATTSRRRGSLPTCSTKVLRSRSRRFAVSTSRSSSTMQPCTRRSPSRCSIPGEGDSARGPFSGQWRGVVRPLLEWTAHRREFG